MRINSYCGINSLAVTNRSKIKRDEGGHVFVEDGGLKLKSEITGVGSSEISVRCSQMIENGEDSLSDSTSRQVICDDLNEIRSHDRQNCGFESFQDPNIVNTKV